MDLDADGNKDILSGSYSRHSQPMAGLFQVLWGQPDGSFKQAAVLNGSNGEPLIIPADEKAIVKNICTRPFALDWDADGDLDLVVGNFEGTFYLFTGEGKGQFQAEPKLITIKDDEPLRIQGAHSDPFPVDWDADGDFDLVSGSSNGGAQWAENTAGGGKMPVFNQFVSLIEATPRSDTENPRNADELVGPTHATRVWVDDVNGDGKLDLLMGDSVQLVSPVEGLTEEEFATKQREWQKRYSEASKSYGESGGDEAKRTAAIELIQRIYTERAEFIVEDYTGFVWLYLQK